MAGLNNLVGGFMQGADWRMGMEEQKERRQDRQANREGRRIWLENEIGAEKAAEYSSLFDPYEMRLRGPKGMWQNMKGFFTGNRMTEVPGQSSAPSAIPTREQVNQAVPGYYQDGGRVRGGRNNPRRATPAADDFSTTEGRQPWNGLAEGVRSVANVLSPNRGDAPAAFPGVRRALDAAGEEFQGMGEEYDRFGGGSRGSGAAIRKGVGGIGIGALVAPFEAARDITAPAFEFIGGALGLHEDSQRQAPEAAPAPSSDPAVESAVAATPPTDNGGAATSAQGPSYQQQQEDLAESEDMLEAAALGNADIDPADMPRFSTRDWEAYREEYVTGAILQGIDPLTAHNQVTDMQQQGFLRFGQQAAAMLDAGNPMGAARALTAAYQYFPNGTDTRFGIQTGPDGEQVLVGYAINEETGEPTGRAQAITSQYLASAMMNFQDSEAFSNWTQDQHKFAQELREYYEVTRPESQSLIDDRYGGLAIDRFNAESRRMEALDSIASNSTGAGGMRQADYDRANAVFDEKMELLSYDDPQTARQLSSAMSRYYVAEKRYDPGIDYNTVYNRVMGAYEDGTLPQLMEQLGGP
jgi:hypothetical protein